eukprot:14506883-Heterocapsa_arctica.AAC.1
MMGYSFLKSSENDDIIATVFMAIWRGPGLMCATVVQQKGRGDWHVSEPGVGTVVLREWPERPCPHPHGQRGNDSCCRGGRCGFSHASDHGAGTDIGWFTQLAWYR